MLSGKSSRRNPTRLITKNATKTIPTGPSVEFRWSTAVIDQATKAVHRPPNPLPLLIEDSYRHKSHIINSTHSDRGSSVSSSLSMQKYPRRSPHSSNKRQQTTTKQNTPGTSMHPPVDRCPTSFQPLLLNYSQLHRLNQQREHDRLSQSRASIDKLSGVSIVKRKFSVSSSSSVVLPPLVEKVRLPTNRLVGLHTPQLHLFNISDKCTHEAKEPYFDATSKVLVPRMSTMQVS
ncbi:unnamed protein product [Rotaria magnacalcarata]|uniref:Uncharacterized protein n=1 Tax=Rotaria magnacalcarata TaxID=392030 RepID=A0A818XTY8_9BILA|nr:unnamed protein product [Rotaria magnacalcarata]CAF2242669.1 unnamed protein product [Rotaria magnacalcarata]CAF3744206.1 unnamed protein product [Rotaria magnacalcarata]CAF3817491.1 unnamed protein product [Rotaria magnacalcarata]